MGNYSGPKVRLSRALGVPIAETPKHVSPRKTTRPGQHGFRRVKPTLYGTQLKEKQKIACYYNLQNKQLRRYMKMAENSKQTTDREFQVLLETRLDNVIRRLRWARTIWQARQMVGHGHFLVNGRKVDLPSYRVKAGDMIEVKERSKKFAGEVIETTKSMGFAVPEWLVSDEATLKATVARLPQFEEVRLPFDVEFSSIIEYYTR
jgi:small subunit ribosomal protein S4